MFDLSNENGGLGPRILKKKLKIINSRVTSVESGLELLVCGLSKIE